MYGPFYRPYQSVFYFGHYPRYYRPRRPVTLNVYRTRTVHYRTRTNFTVVRTSRVRSVNKVGYKPTASRLLEKGSTSQTGVSGSGVQTTGNTRTTQGVSRTVTNPSTGRTTNVKAGRSRVSNPGTGQARTVKGVSKTKVNSSTGAKKKVSAGKAKGSKGGKKTKVQKTKTKKKGKKVPR